MRILIAEDDAVLADGLSRSLRAGGYAVDVVASGDDADTALTAQSFDLLILDVGLPRLSGLEVLKRLRARNSAVPVLILTAADSVEQRVKGLDLGADDYMAKPFALSELEARVRALTRRAAGGAQTVLRHGPLALDQVGHTAFLNDRMLDLSARELSLLEILLQRPGRLVSKEQLVDHLCSHRGVCPSPAQEDRDRCGAHRHCPRPRLLPRTLCRPDCRSRRQQRMTAGTAK
jgi:two-component system OmpR family response regulator